MTADALRAPTRPPLKIKRERALQLLFGLMIFLGFLVFVEPAPFDLIAVVFMPAVLFSRFKLDRLVIVLALILLLYNIGGFFSLIPWWHEQVSVVFTVLSLYLAILCVFFAVFFSRNSIERAELCLKAYTASAIIVAISGILGYFNVFGLFETLTLYGRAKGTFKDPNVYGPYLSLGILYLMQLLALKRTRHVVFTVLMLCVLMFGLLLSFSRGAWGAFVISASMMIFAGFLTAPTMQVRKRIVMLTVIVMASVALALFIAFLDPSTRELFIQRFAVTQYYDEGETGRFGSQLRSLTDLIEMPNGYGPMRYKHHQGGDPHNSYVNAFASYGWLGGFSFFVLVILSYFIGFRLLFARSPVQHAAQVFFPCLFTSFLQAMQIDIDHWRHVYLFIGAVWGLEAARLRWLRTGAMDTDAGSTPPARRDGLPAG